MNVGSHPRTAEAGVPAAEVPEAPGRQTPGSASAPPTVQPWHPPDSLLTVGGASSVESNQLAGTEKLLFLKPVLWDNPGG